MVTTAVEIVRVDVEAVASWDSEWRVRAVKSDGTLDSFWSDADTLNDAIEEAIDRYDLPACRDDFGVALREGWAIWERGEDGDKPTLTTKDGLTVYDLDPQSSELWVIVAIALVFFALAPFGALKLYEILKYIYQHLQWVP